MWALKNRTSYGAERNWIRDKTGHHHWLVAVRATFDIGHRGRLTLADHQPAPAFAPEFRGDPATTSLRRDSDLLAVKPGTDVVVDAMAHAPGGRPAASVPVSLRFADVEKTLVVYGTRVYYRGAVGMTTSAPRPFIAQAIKYEHAYGGSDTSATDPRRHRIDMRNPVGRGVAVEAQQLEHQPAHLVEYPRGDFRKVGPAGFGPVASFWSPRIERGGTYDERWTKTKKPLLPDDYDDRFALSAPDDQRTARPLRGGETLSATNMSADGSLQMVLPKIFLAFRTRVAGRFEEHRATLVTVFLAPEERTLSLTWQSTLPVGHRDVEHLDQTVISEKTYLA
jgi:hypothetical protein